MDGAISLGTRVALMSERSRASRRPWSGWFIWVLTPPRRGFSRPDYLHTIRSNTIKAAPTILRPTRPRRTHIDNIGLAEARISTQTHF